MRKWCPSEGIMPVRSAQNYFCRCLCPTVSLGCSPLPQEPLQHQQAGLVWAPKRPWLIFLGLGVHRTWHTASESRVSVVPSPVGSLGSNTTGFQHHVLWGLLLLLPDPQAGESDMGLRTFSMVGKFCGITVFQFVGHSRHRYSIRCYPDCAHTSILLWLLLCLWR